MRRKICQVLAVLALALCGTILADDPSIFSWVHWTPSGATVESQIPGVKVKLYDPIGDRSVDSVSDLQTLGWHITADGFLQSPDQSGGNRLTVQLEGLPPGEHTVYLRFFGRPRQAGESWWFLTWIDLGDGVGAGERQDVPVNAAMYQNGPAGGEHPITLISGTGGFDDSTVYELKLGSVKDTDQVSLWFERYEWTRLSRIGSIRIETAPDISLTETLKDTAPNNRVRAALLAEGGDYGFGVISGAVKVRPKRFNELAGQEISKKIDLHAGRNEWENAQVILYSDQMDLEDVTWQVGKLQNEAGEVFTGKLELQPVGFVKVEHFDVGINGYWPDPILPGLKRLTIPRGDVQPLWFRVKVPADAEPGIYTGEVTLSPANAIPVKMPVSLTVRSYTLPEMSALRVVMGCNDGSGGFETDYKINPSTIYGWLPEYDGLLDKWAERHAAAVNLDYIWGAQIDQTAKMPTPEQIDNWIAVLKQRLGELEKAGLKDKAYVYCFDEATAPWIPALKAVTAAIKREFPDLPIMTTAHLPWLGGDSVDTIDWWCPQINHYDLQKADEARAAGKQIWMYVCNNPEKPYANLRLYTNTAMDHRLLLGFMAAAFRYDGFLYWSTRANWREPITQTSVYTNWLMADDGDGQLYQSSRAGYMLPTLRLENMRDGLEDYDLLHMARKLAENPDRLSPEARKRLAEVQSFLAPGNAVVNSQTDFTQSPEILEKARREVMDFVDLAQP